MTGLRTTLAFCGLLAALIVPLVAAAAPISSQSPASAAAPSPLSPALVGGAALTDDSFCSQADDNCVECQKIGCGFCFDNNLCMAGSAGGPSNNTCTVWSVDTCPGSGGGPIINGSGGYPAPGIGAIVLLCVLLPGLVALIVGAILTKRFCPEVGGSPPASCDFSSGSLRWMALALAFVAVAVKVVAMGIDEWSGDRYDEPALPGESSASVKYGLLAMRVRYGDEKRKQKYADLCHMMKEGGAISWELGMCRTLRTGGITTLAFGALSGLMSLVLLVAFMVAIYKRTLSDKALKLWRVAAIATISSVGAMLLWLSGAMLVLHHWDGEVKVDASVWAMLAAWLVDLVMLLAMRRACHAGVEEWAADSVYRRMRY